MTSSSISLRSFSVIVLVWILEEYRIKTEFYERYFSGILALFLLSGFLLLGHFYTLLLQHRISQERARILNLDLLLSRLILAPFPDYQVQRVSEGFLITTIQSIMLIFWRQLLVGDKFLYVYNFTFGDLILNGDKPLSCKGLWDRNIERGKFSGQRNLIVSFLLLNESYNFFLTLEFFKGLIETVNYLR